MTHDTTSGTGTTVSNNLLWASQEIPKELHQTGSCPKCGAPIFIDAKLVKKNGKLKGLPSPHFTCQCRFQAAPINVPYIQQPLVPNTPWFPPATPSPWAEPQITWTVAQPCTTHPNAPQTTGVLHSKPMPGVICMNMSRSLGHPTIEA